MNDKKPPSRTADQFVIRLPVGMRDRIAESAEKNRRSMNAEIVARIQHSYEYAESHKQLSLEDMSLPSSGAQANIDQKLQLLEEQNTRLQNFLDEMMEQLASTFKWDLNAMREGLINKAESVADNKNPKRRMNLKPRAKADKMVLLKHIGSEERPKPRSTGPVNSKNSREKP